MKAGRFSREGTIWTNNFICVFVIYAMLQFSHSSINSLVSTYAVFLGSGPVIMGMLTGMLFVVALAMRPFIGPMTSKFDRRTLMIMASITGLLVYVGYALFHNIATFVVFRIISGFQYATIGTLGMTMAADSVPEKKMATGISMYTIGGAILAVFGPGLGIACRDLGTRLVGEDFGFTLLFLIGAVGMAVSLLASLCLNEKGRVPPTRAEIGAWYKNIIDVNVLPTALMSMLFVTGFSILTAYMVPFTAERGIGGASAFFALMGITMFAIRPISGRLIERYGIIKFFVPITLVYILSFFVIGSARSVWSIYIGAVLSGAGYSGSAPALQTMAMQCVMPQKRAVASNTLYAGLDLGNFSGPFLGGIVYGISNYGTAMIVSAVPIFIGFGLFFVIWPAYTKRSNYIKSIAAPQSQQ